jgi:hypothetical protein
MTAAAYIDHKTSLQINKIRPAMHQHSHNSQDFLRAKQLLSEIEIWLENAIENSDKISAEERGQLINDIEKTQLNLHLFERLISQK